MSIDPKTEERLFTLLENLTKEQRGWRRFFCRWAISAEPLRKDARELLKLFRRIRAHDAAVTAASLAAAQLIKFPPREQSTKP